MQTPLQISVRGMDSSPEIHEEIRDLASRLDHYYESLVGCRVLLESPHHHHRQGTLYHVRIELHVPGKTLVVSRDPAADHAREDVHVALRDAFDAARRRLQDYARTQRGDTKNHAAPELGRVLRLFPGEGYGFLVTADGREVYFHENAVLPPGFDRLAEGTAVRYAEEMGNEGPQASTVTMAE